MRVRVLHAKLYAYALPGSTARQLFISSTLLDSSTGDSYSTARQTSTHRHMESASTGSKKLDRNSTGTRQARQARPRQRPLDSSSTEPRQLDSSTARAQQTECMPSLCPRCHSIQIPSRFHRACHSLCACVYARISDVISDADLFSCIHSREGVDHSGPSPLAMGCFLKAPGHFCLP